MTFDDLVELARLCLKRAAETSNPAAAVQLRRIASEYQARAAGLGEAPTPVIPKPSPQEAPPRGLRQGLRLIRGMRRALTEEEQHKIAGRSFTAG
jgi:hypothetical protein